ncbi:DUF953 family protein [Schizosaccharomyces japonicus yFS275]|uniref:DUF953 family protein n=1 Tax=Schizosaccharomyces japonicus (strain yFS275 / FY16936) TaxID=402676 RepID=B6JVS3_SCHJY|nr:DUF953 family protein [Schizosaccharomyces japonicus yFS275]EEB05474.1 DUF953 family protein [Schizosaccharomyces japonicus yFS275]
MLKELISGSLEATLKAIPKGKTLYVAYLASIDPRTKQPWCPTVRAALPSFNSTFNNSNKLDLVHVYVGGVSQWKTPANEYRIKYGITAVPTLGRYTRTEDGTLEQDLLVDYDCLDAKKFQKFVQ